MSIIDPLPQLIEQAKTIITNSKSFSLTLQNEATTLAAETLQQESDSAQCTTEPLAKLSLYLSSLVNYTNTLSTNSLRNTKRCRTTGPSLPLRIVYDRDFRIPEISIWESPLKQLEDLLVKSYHKLVSYNADLKENIEPVLKASADIRAQKEETPKKLAEFLGKGLGMLNEVLDQAYGLVEVTKKLQEIQNEQITFRKESYDTYTTVKNLLNVSVPQLRGNRKKTYVRVFMADPENDNLPLQTVFHLLEDIQRNQGMIKDLETTKQETLKEQERARELVEHLNSYLATHTQLAQTSSDNPLIDVYEKALAITKHSEQGTTHSLRERLQEVLNAQGTLQKSSQTVFGQLTSLMSSPGHVETPAISMVHDQSQEESLSSLLSNVSLSMESLQKLEDKKLHTISSSETIQQTIQLINSSLPEWTEVALVNEELPLSTLIKQIQLIIVRITHK